ncbi:MAG: ATP-binding protein, partial [Thermoplasmata archaeon]
ARDIIALTTIKNVRQYLAHLRKAIDTLRQTKGKYTIEEIISVLETEQEYVVGTLINELEYLKDVEIFAEVGTHVNEIVVKGKTSIINLRGTPPDIQELIVTRLCNALFELRKINKIPPLILVVEEAHNFCPQQGQAASSKILRTIASEGRKFGLGLCIISQRPAKVDKNVLSQCNTQIILKITNPNDLKAVAASVEGITSGTMDEIQSLPIGTALITSPSLPIPLFVEIRPRETKHGGEAVKIIE